jgi:hypothetical protein
MGSGIVLELQREALDENKSIEMLLRKAYLVAKKLKLEDLEKWLTQEQNGYNSKVPEYRMLSGELKAWNPYHGWIPIVMDAELSGIVSKMPLGLSISAIVDSYASSSGSVVLSVNGEITDVLNKVTDSIPTKYGFIVSKSELYRIMSTVRNKILEWAILLEDNGILGEEMMFTEEEKTVATASPIINNYTNNFYGDIKDLDMAQGREINRE